MGDVLQLKAQLLQYNKSLPATNIQDAVTNVASPIIDLGAFIKKYRVNPKILQRLKKEVKELKNASENELKLYVLSQDKKAVANVTKMQIQTFSLVG